MRLFLILPFAMGAVLSGQTTEKQMAVRPRPAVSSFQPTTGMPTPTGFSITPLAAPGSTFVTMNPGLPSLPNYLAGQPMTTSLSPNGKTLLVLTSGYNLLNGPDGKNLAAAGNEYVFIYDVATNKLIPLGAVPLPAAFAGLAWNPSGAEFYVSGGAGDLVFVVTLGASGPALGGTIMLKHPTSPSTLGPGLGLGQPSVVAGLAVNQRGDRLLSVNMTNDSVTLIDIPNRKVITELDLRPGVANASLAGTPGGEYPFWAVIKGNDKAYVSSMRDREIDVLSLAGDQPSVTSRIAVQGNPNKMILNKAQNLLLASVDNADIVAVVETNLDAVVDTIQTTAPTSPIQNVANFQKGSNPNSVALSPDERTLYVTNGGTNSVAVIALNTLKSPSFTAGLIPTGWYPEAVTVSLDGSTLFIANGKSLPGPNPQACKHILGVGADNDPTCNAANQYVLQLEKGGMSTIPVPSRSTLANLSAQTSANNNFTPADSHGANADLMGQLRQKIQHVIYIVKENRTYDQILGDLEKGNGDPSSAVFTEPYTPNQHQIARSSSRSTIFTTAAK